MRPVGPDLLVDLLTPALALVGGVGMTGDARTEWMIAAGMALGHLPEDLLRQGVKAAMRTADHPSKIVAAIIADTEKQFDQRRRYRDDVASTNGLIAGTLALIERHRATPQQVDEIMAEHGIASHKPKPIEPRALHNPTVADYVELGLSQEQAQEAVKTLLPAPKPRGDTAKPIGDIAIPTPTPDDPQAEAVG